MKTFRLLILSEQNNPDWISVPLVGFRHSEALAQLHQVHLVTHIRNKPAHDKYPNLYHKITYIDLGVFDRLFAWAFIKIFNEDFGSQALTAFRIPFYLGFEWLAFRKLKVELKHRQFDCVLRLTPVAPVIPSPFARWLRKYKIPFVIGPINGGLPFPANYQQANKQKEWISGFRAFYRFLPYAKSTYLYASAIICGSSQTCREFQSFSEKVHFIPENGILSQAITHKTQISSAQRPLNLIFVGRLVPFKACDLAILGAKKLLKTTGAMLYIVGDGSERLRLEDLVTQHELKSRVVFVGMVSHTETMQYFAKADILVFPSVREFGGGVVFEALASGVVPIVADYGGPGDIVREEFGYKIPMLGEAESIASIDASLQELHLNRSMLIAKSRAGQHYARESLSWQGKAKLMSTIIEATHAAQDGKSS